MPYWSVLPPPSKVTENFHTKIYLELKTTARWGEPLIRNGAEIHGEQLPAPFPHRNRGNHQEKVRRLQVHRVLKLLLVHGKKKKKCMEATIQEKLREQWWI